MQNRYDACNVYPSSQRPRSDDPASASVEPVLQSVVAVLVLGIVEVAAEQLCQIAADGYRADVYDPTLPGLRSSSR